MQKICERLLNFVQIIDHKGTVRLCSWLNNNNIGTLSSQSMKKLFHGERAKELRERLISGDYSLCNVDACPYLAMNDIEKHLVEVDEVPEYPEALYLAFENVCNYHCISCNVHDIMIANKDEDLEKGYNKIEAELKGVLPHVKKLGANGCGELFVSKRILKILSEWKPLAPKEEVSVALETNGALFDEKHWKQIENLGKYYLKVAVTVMSFDEQTYQLLSGTKLPISQIENNLRFIKRLREQGIVNYFEIATVVQERNFRTVPEFARRCVEEFGADYVRLRPYSPWGSQEPEIEWFMDIRNPQHPYYSEYREMKKDAIFKHPRIHDWSGDLDTVNVKVFPYKLSYYKEQMLTEIITNIDVIITQLKDFANGRQIVIYGLGIIGKLLVKQLIEKGVRPLYILDKYNSNSKFQDVDVFNIGDTRKLSKNVAVIITPILNNKEIHKDLSDSGYQDSSKHIAELLTDKGMAEKILNAIS